MRDLRRLVRCSSLAVALCAVPLSSSAELLIIVPKGATAPLAQAELAYSVGDGPSATWLALRASADPVAIVAALPNGARAEPGPDAWFASLQGCGSPTIVPPESARVCPGAAAHLQVAWPRGAGEPASELELRARADVAVALEEQGLQPPSELPEADRYVVWSWTKAADLRSTRTLRILGAAEPLAPLPGQAFPVIVNAFTPGPKLLPAELASDQLRVTFSTSGDTDYLPLLRDWLAVRPEPLLETRWRGVLFDWSILADAVSLRPLSESYARAAASELGGIDAEACAAQLSALRRGDAAPASECGDALDFGWALAGPGGQQATLQRWVVSSARGFAPDELRAGGAPRAPLLRASRFDDADCREDPPQAIVVDPPQRSGSSGPDPGGSEPGSGTTTVVVEKTVVVEEQPVGEVGCGSSSGRDPYYDERDTDCSADTSDSAGSDDACAGDSSSSSQSDGCSSDSSSDTSSDSGCSSGSEDTSSDSGCSSGSEDTSSDSGCSSGSEDSSYDGDTCTGRAAPAAERSQQLQARVGKRPRRVKTSLWSLALSAAALPIRRRKRRKI
jgi:hypothetical protein